MGKRPLIILTGPTAVGKTKLAVSLAKAVSGEIISADCMQVYRHMDIGSAKVREEEKEGITHYLIDVLEPEEEFHVALFCEMAKEALKKIYEKGKLPIVSGGTGFYIHALLYGAEFKEEPGDKTYRSYLEGLAKDKGAAYLHGMLACVDKAAADAIHQNNIKRVIRALEFYKSTGIKISEHNEKEREKKSPYNAAYFVLTDDREKLYARIDQRVDAMMGEGLVDEVKRLKERGLSQRNISMQGLGYRQILNYLEGGSGLEEAVYMIKRDTRHYAKRQLTWFKREKNVIWLNRRDFGYDQGRISEYMLEVLREKEIIS